MGSFDAAGSLVNSVLRCSWYLVTRCLSEIRAARERGTGRREVTALTQSRGLREARRVALRRHIMPALLLVAASRAVRTTPDSSRLRLDSIRFDSTRLECTSLTQKSSRSRHTDNDNPTSAQPSTIDIYRQYSDIDIIRDDRDLTECIFRLRLLKTPPADTTAAIFEL